MSEPTPTPFVTDALRWEALVRRDRSAEGAFLYAVKTTGVYCRPTCASRLPRLENVTFFASSGEAERAGFRACKRCRPNAASRRTRHGQTVAHACRLIEEAETPPALNELAAAVGLSPFHFHRVFKNAVGVTPREYAAAHRLRRVQDGLRGGASVTRTIYDAGFGSSSRVYEKTATQLGMTPRHYQRNGAGMQIQYTIVPCALGQLLVATTERGVCAVKLGDNAGELERILFDEFSAANIVRHDQAHGDWVQAILEFVAGSEPHLDLPLDVRATAFQKQVWQALQKIPYGETRTYSDIARSIGQPSAVRAVATACGANPAALVVPCHRIVRSDGGLGGYRWGIERKRELLAREAKRSQPDGE